jgi:D-alanyl-lipoteichoic acid acyltransferase DltB (MBOAT superfamily)
LPSLVILLVVHPLLRRLYDTFWTSSIYASAPKADSRSDRLTQGLSSTAAADARLDQRVSFDYCFALIFISALHGFSAAKVLLILFLNYKLAKSLPRHFVPFATWGFNIGILFANEFARGYQYASIAQHLTLNSEIGSALVNFGAWLDSHGGLNPRWEVLFNFTVLRMISFNMDYYWSIPTRSTSPVEVRSPSHMLIYRANGPKKKQLDPSNLSERDRAAIPAKPEDYSFRNYLSYLLYAPLYNAGPIITFNDYICQSRYPLPTISKQGTILYGVRFLVVLLTMEFLIHFIYVVAIAKSNPDWNIYTPLQLSMLGYFNLIHIWLKLLIPWRFFRLWGLLDGIDGPENMVRCMSNNYSALGFWRNWHRSYNRWLTRYLYIPLGGSRVSQVVAIRNIAITFAFVAIWHDINLRLLMWGWLITIFIIPEVLAAKLFPAKKWTDQPNAYRWLCGLGATGNELMMMIANLVGYALGLDGLKGLLVGLLGNASGLVVAVGIISCLFIGSQVMFEVREREKRRGIWLKC